MRLPRRQSADLGRAGARRKSRVERIDVEAEIAGCLADDRADTLRDRLGAVLMHFLGGDDGHAAARPSNRKRRVEPASGCLSGSFGADRRDVPRWHDRIPNHAHRADQNCPARYRHGRRNERARAGRLRRASARSKASVMPCSPPSATRWSTAAACSSMTFRLAGISPSAIRKSPISDSINFETLIHAVGCAPSTSIRLAWRMACGPKRAPLRLVVPISSGMPAIEIAASRSRRPNPRNPGGTAKVGGSLAILFS